MTQSVRSPTITVGINKTGVFWTRTTSVAGTSVYHPKSYYQTQAGLLLPLSDMSYSLVEFIKKSFDIVKTDNVDEYVNSIKTYMPPTIRKLCCINVDHKGKVWQIMGGVINGHYEVIKLPVPLPEKGFYIFSNEIDLAQGLTLASEKFLSYKKLLEFSRENFLFSPRPDIDTFYMSYKDLAKQKPENAIIITNAAIKIND